MAVIIGLDPGLADTGYGVIEAGGGKIRHLAHGSIRTSAKTDQGERLKIIYEGLMTLLEEYSPQAAGIEALFFAKNRTSAIPVAEARGVLLLALCQKGIAAFEYPPQAIKQALTGDGRAEKHQVQTMVKLLLGLKEIPSPDHAADALGAAVCCYHNQGAMRSV
jgi:crossover junction endodeoxyribonuclease RuvC